jgi:hypothetical protein
MSKEATETATKVVEKTVEKVKDDPAALLMLAAVIGGLVYLTLSVTKQGKAIKRVEAVAERVVPTIEEQQSEPQPNKVEKMPSTKQG